MRILVIPHAYYPVVGGTEENIRRVCEGLSDKGHTMQVLTADVGAVQGYYEPGIPLISKKEEIVNGVSVIRIPYGRGILPLVALLLGIRGNFADGIRGRLMAVVRRRFERKLETRLVAFAPDVVVTLPHLIVNVVCTLNIRKRRDFPLVMVPMLHEHDPGWPIEEMRGAVASASSLVTMTEYEAGQLVSAYSVDKARVFVGSVGVDVENPIPKKESNTNPYVFFLGRCAKSKGLDKLIEAMTYIWPDNSEVRLVIGGVILPETEAIKQQIQDLPNGWAEKVSLIGAVSGKRKRELLADTRCLVLPSEVESFGMVLLEAWSEGTPVVTWDLPVFREIVTDGRDGFLARVGDVEELAQAITKLLKNDELARNMGAAGCDKVRKKYRWDKVCDAYEAACRYAVSAPRPVQ